MTQAAMDALVKGAIKSGDLRKEINSSDLLRALIGVFYVGAGPDSQQSARRVVDILIDGSRLVK
jgi:dsRNA-specific ribonuclease